MGDSCPAMCVEQAIGPRADRPSVCDSIRQPLPHVLIPTMRKQYAGMDDRDNLKLINWLTGTPAVATAGSRS
jgi:hypothetical protein